MRQLFATKGFSKTKNQKQKTKALILIKAFSGFASEPAGINHFL